MLINRIQQSFGFLLKLIAVEIFQSQQTLQFENGREFEKIYNHIIQKFSPGV